MTEMGHENIGIELEQPKSLKDKILKSEAFKIGASVFLGLILLLVILPFFFDNSALKFQIVQKVSQISGANFVINGNVRIALLPVPSITANDVLLQNYKPKIFAEEVENKSQKIYNLYAKSVKIKLPIFQFSSDAVINEITFTDAILESYGESDIAMERKDQFTEVIAQFSKDTGDKEEKKLGSGISAKMFAISDLKAADLKIENIPDIVIQNGQTIFYDHIGRKREVQKINSEIEISRKKILAKGDFSSESIVSNFKFIAKFNSNKPESSLEITSPVMEMRIKGNFPSENKGFLESEFKGKLEAEILELKSFYRSYISGNSVVYNKLKYSSKPLKISADLKNKDKEISVDNVVINSALVNGKGDLEVNFVDKIPLIDISLALENLDLDNIWSGDPVSVAASAKQPNNLGNIIDESVETLVKTTPQPEPKDETAAKKEVIEKTKIIDGSKKIEPINFDFTNKIKDFDLNAEIKITNVKYFEGEIKDVDLYMTVSKEGEILILPMIFRVPGEGLFRVNGALDNTGAVPKFVGKFDVNGKSLKEIFNWLKVESQNLKFDNLKEYSLYSDILLSPNEITLNNFYLNLGNGTSEFLGEIKIDNSDRVSNVTSRFQTNDFNIDDYFLTSGQNIYLSPGLLIKKLLWLNNISSNNALNLRFDKLSYKGEEFFDQSVKLRFGRGYIEVADLNLKSDKTKMNASLAIDISDKIPKFDMNVVADNFHYETLQKNISPADKNSDKAPNKNFFDQFYALPSLEGFSGKIKLSFDKLNLDNVEIKNFKLVGKLKDGDLDDSEFSCDLYEGKVTYKGLVGIKMNKTINGNLQFNNASLRPLLSDSLGINNVSGIANISASITALASKKEDFTKELTTEIKFNANSPTVEGYGLNELVKKMFNPENNRASLNDPEKVLINPNSSTTFKQASGTIQVTNGKEGKLRISVTAPAVNGIISGSVNLVTNSADVLFNAIFLTGSRQKQTPINIATNLKGNIGALSQSTNMDQARQYLGLSGAVPKQKPKEDLSRILPPQENGVPIENAPFQIDPVTTSTPNQ
ncbi:MAG: AsmA family protein [Pseudomonadota bacterium]